MEAVQTTAPVGESLMDERGASMESWLPSTDSPIERGLGLELACLRFNGRVPILGMDWGVPYLKDPARWNDGAERVELWTQRVLCDRQYRVDFHILARLRGAIRSYVIECDGISYHGDRHAFVADRRRDRALAADGHFVIRFAGAEIHENALACAQEVAAIIARWDRP